MVSITIAQTFSRSVALRVLHFSAFISFVSYGCHGNLSDQKITYACTVSKVLVCMSPEETLQICIAYFFCHALTTLSGMLAQLEWNILS